MEYPENRQKPINYTPYGPNIEYSTVSKCIWFQPTPCGFLDTFAYIYGIYLLTCLSPPLLLPPGTCQKLSKLSKKFQKSAKIIFHLS